jgi:DNA-binding CsgD family transcriptional regulator
VSVTVCLGRDATTAARFTAREFVAAVELAPVVNALARLHWRDLGPGEDAGTQDVSGMLRQRILADKGISLSGRQSEIALLILQGHSSISIGLTLGISPQTVKVIRKQLYRKCQISSQAELFSLLSPYLLGI